MTKVEKEALKRNLGILPQHAEIFARMMSFNPPPQSEFYTVEEYAHEFGCTERISKKGNALVTLLIDGVPREYEKAKASTTCTYIKRR